MSLSHPEGRPRIETPCQKPFQTERGGRVSWVWNRIFWWVPSTPFPTPQLLHALIKVRSVKNFKASSVWQTVIKQEISKKKKKKKSAKAHGGSRADKCYDGSVFVISRPTAGHFLLTGSWARAVSDEGGQKGRAAEGCNGPGISDCTFFLAIFHPVCIPTQAHGLLQPKCNLDGSLTSFFQKELCEKWEQSGLPSLPLCHEGLGVRENWTTRK